MFSSHHLGMADNTAQYIVEIMRDAAGENTDPLHASRLLETLFQPRCAAISMARRSTA